MPDDLQDIEAKIAELQAEKQKILDEKRGSVLEELRKNVLLFGFTAKEIGLSTRTKSSASATPATPKESKPVTYRDDSDPANILEWDGEINQKGRKPEWIKQRIQNGTLAQFRVTKA